MVQTSPLVSPTDYRTKTPYSEKELFHILPKLQARRGDFLTVMLTGSLHQRRGFLAPPPDTQDEGPRDDDVTKTDSHSTDQSQDGPGPSTLLADDPHKEPRDLGSVAEIDPDPEDVSKTLLFSPGDDRRSADSGDAPDGPGTEDQHRLCHAGKKRAQEGATKRHGTMNSVRQDRTPSCLIKVKERNVPDTKSGPEDVTSDLRRTSDSSVFTYNKAEIYPSVCLSVSRNETRDGNGRLDKPHRDSRRSKFGGFPGPTLNSNQPEQRTTIGEDHLGSSRTMKPIWPAPVAVQNSTDSCTVEQTFSHIAESTHHIIMSSKDLHVQEEPDHHNQNWNLKTTQHYLELSSQTYTGEPQVPEGPVQRHISVPYEVFSKKSKEDPRHVTSEDTRAKSIKSSLRPKIRSRIPVLVPEDPVGTDAALVPREQTQRTSTHHDLSRVVLERQRHVSRLNSRTSWSVSSGDEPRRASETPSNAASEEDAHHSDHLSSQFKEDKRARGCDGWQSRIPRPATPKRRPSTRPMGATATLTLPGKSTTAAESRIPTENNGYTTQLFS